MEKEISAAVDSLRLNDLLSTTVVKSFMSYRISRACAFCHTRETFVEVTPLLSSRAVLASARLAHVVDAE